MMTPFRAVSAILAAAALAAAASSCSRRTPPPAPGPEPESAAVPGAAASHAEEAMTEAARAAAEAAAREAAAEAAEERGRRARAALESTRGPADPAAALALRTPPKSKAAKGKTTGRAPWRGAIAVDAGTGEILFEDGADVPCLPASMVKLMLLLLVEERVEAGTVRLDDMVAVSTRAYKTGGSQVYLDPRESFSVEDMLYAVIVQSANDAAVALAEHVAGSCEAMVALMNRRASELGMRDTVFESVNGLPADASAGALDDVTTPRDMAVLSCEICKHPDALRYTSESYRVFRPEPRLFEMRTHNPALQTGTRIAGADGLKTGYTRRAGYSLAVSAERAGRRVVAVAMGIAVADAKGELDVAASKKTRNARISELVERAFSTPRSGASGVLEP